MNIMLYPELVDYICGYCHKYYTEKESLANRHLFALSKSHDGENNRMYKFFMKETTVEKDEEVQNLISGGFEAFRSRVAHRIFTEYRKELNLNLCPKCFKIARTPQAKQCRFCFYDWH